MSTIRTLAFALAAGLLTFAFAFESTLSDALVQEALQAGDAMVGPESGYRVQDYVVWDDPEPIVIEEGDGQVEAVVAGTPFERLRYSSYLSHYQEGGMSAESARQEADALANTVHFVVFAHSPSGDEAERDFLSRFGAATFTVADGTTLEPATVETFGPAMDFYTHEGRAQFLWLGYVSYIFDFSELANSEDISGLQGTLAFSDSSGHDYSFEVDLSEYR